MNPRLRYIAVFALSLLPAIAAEPDADALAKERAQLERNFSRESQKIDQANEQAMIPINSKRRELSARIERENSTVLNLATYLASNGTTGLDLDKMQQIRFEQLEGNNQIDHQMLAEVEQTIQVKRDELERRRTLEFARLDAKGIADSDDASKQRAQAIKRAEITAKWQEKIDTLNREGKRAESKLVFERTTVLDHLDSEIYGAEQRFAVETMRKLQKGGSDAKNLNILTAAQPMNEATAPLKLKRDDAVNALETSREELRAKYNSSRTDLENSRDDELAKLDA